jgi:cobalt-zinc-cadmium efflux system protein
VVADALGSVGVIVAALLVTATGNAFWDTAVALATAAFVAVRAVMLGREVLVVLGQHAPAELNPEEVAGALAAVPGGSDVQDVHLWT